MRGSVAARSSFIALARDDEDYDVAGVTAHVAARLEQAAEAEHRAAGRPGRRGLVSGIATLQPVGELDTEGRGSAGGCPSPAGRDRPAVLGPCARGSVRCPPWSGARRRSPSWLGCWSAPRAAGRRAIALVGRCLVSASRGLVHELVDGLSKDEWRVIRVDTTAQTLAIPYFLVTALLRQLLGCLPEDTPAERAARLASAAISLGFDEQFDTAPLLVHLDSGAGGLRQFRSRVRRRQQLLAALRPIVTRYAELHSLVWVGEDYQWLDLSSAELLGDLLEGMGVRPAVGAAYHTAGAPAGLADPQRCGGRWRGRPAVRDGARAAEPGAIGAAAA